MSGPGLPGGPTPWTWCWGFLRPCGPPGTGSWPSILPAAGRGVVVLPTLSVPCIWVCSAPLSPRPSCSSGTPPQPTFPHAGTEDTGSRAPLPALALSAPGAPSLWARGPCREGQPASASPANRHPPAPRLPWPWWPVTSVLPPSPQSPLSSASLVLSHPRRQLPLGPDSISRDPSAVLELHPPQAQPLPPWPLPPVPGVALQ